MQPNPGVMALTTELALSRFFLWHPLLANFSCADVKNLTIRHIASATAQAMPNAIKSLAFSPLLLIRTAFEMILSYSMLARRPASSNGLKSSVESDAFHAVHMMISK